MAWVPELQSIPKAMWSEVTDAKRGEIVKHIADLPIGRAPFGCSLVFGTCSIPLMLKAMSGNSLALLKFSRARFYLLIYMNTVS